MSNNEENIGVMPHIESSDSERSLSDSSAEHFSEDSSASSESDDSISVGRQNDEEFDLPNIQEPTVFLCPNGAKLFTPNCDKTYKPQTNQHFPTIQDAFIFYREYGRQCGFDVCKSCQKTNRRGKLVSKVIQCSCGGNPDTKKSKEGENVAADGFQSRRTTSRRCFCQARIVLKPAGSRGLVVMSFVEEHNHTMATGPEAMFLRCNRKVSLAHQNFIMNCSRANIGPTRAYTLTKEMVGSYKDVGATVSDFKNFSRDLKIHIGENDASMILSKFKIRKKASGGTFYYDYKVDRAGYLTGIFWIDAIAQANYEVFGDIVSFDPTFCTNKYNMIFVPFTGVDNHWKNVTFAAALIAKENYKNFKWLISTFQSAMCGVPACVITDQCPAIKKAIQINWPTTKHKLCMWHIMNKLPAKIGPKLASDKAFMSKFKSTVYSEHSTPEQFEDGWRSVIAEYKLEGNKWLAGMFQSRRHWIPAFFSDLEMAGLLRTTSRSESTNSFFQHFHQSGNTLVEFYSSFESAMDKQRLRNVDDDKKSRQTPRMNTTMIIEKDAAHAYTLALYYLVREEIKLGCFHTSMPDMTRDKDFRYFTCRDEILDGKLFQVSVREKDNHVECSCKLFFRRGYLCRHAFAALKQCGVHIIPRQFVKPRWCKDALRLYSKLGSSEIPNNTDKSDRAKLKRSRAWFEFNSFLNFAGEDEEKLDTIVSGLHEINSKLQIVEENIELEVSASRAEKFVGPIPPNEEGVRNPLISRNKGCGSHIKSSKEISMQSRKQRTCGNCNMMDGHNARTCPHPKK